MGRLNEQLAAVIDGYEDCRNKVKIHVLRIMHVTYGLQHKALIQLFPIKQMS